MRVTAIVADERGSMSVLGAIVIMAVFIGMLSLTFDIGKLLTLRRKMVNASDAAALAAAQSCALDQGAADATAEANSLALQNQTGLTNSLMDVSMCEESPGELEVAYSLETELDVASVLGVDEGQTVQAGAEAEWGAAGGSPSVAPIELTLGDDGQINCVVDAGETECGYWHDNDSAALPTSSIWGTVDLDTWGVSRTAGCPGNSSKPDMEEWLSGSLALTLPTLPTYVCTGAGFDKAFWMAELPEHVGRDLDFPVNDPTQMFLGAGDSKYAIVGFIRMRLKEVLDGNTPGVLAEEGYTKDCTSTNNFRTGDTLDIDALAIACTGGDVPATISPPKLTKGPKTFKTPQDYTYLHNPAGADLVWVSTDRENGVKVEFTVTVAPKPGLCEGPSDADPANGICLVLTYPGKRIGGTKPGGGAEFEGALQAIRLKG